MKKLILITIVTIMLAAGQADAEPRFVERVIDGQTLKLLSGEHIRLIGIDVPEVDANDPSQMGQKAADFVRGLVSGAVVELEYDVQKQDDQDHILAYLWFEYQINPRNIETLSVPENYDMYYVEDENGVGRFYVFLNSTMIKSGHATPSDESENIKHAQLFQEIYQKRKAQPPSFVQLELNEDNMATAISK